MAQRLIEKIELHDTLNPKLWENNQLRPEVEEKLDDIVDQFILELQNNDIPIKVLDARLVGSNASFNYIDSSDLDVHIVANFADTSCDVPVLNLLYNYFKKNFNDKYIISIHGVPVELYIEDINSSAISNGIYSLYKREWIKFPEPIEIPDIDITDIFNLYKEKYQEIVKNQDADAASDLIDELYLLRKDSISTDGEYGEGNLVFKEFRNRGYLDSLKQLLVDDTSRELSLESLSEALLLEDKESQQAFQAFQHYLGARRDRISNPGGSGINKGKAIQDSRHHKDNTYGAENPKDIEVKSFRSHPSDHYKTFKNAFEQFLKEVKTILPDVGYKDLTTLINRLSDEASKEMLQHRLDATADKYLEYSNNVDKLKELLDNFRERYRNNEFAPKVAGSVAEGLSRDHTEAAVRELGRTFYKTRAGFMLKDGSYLDLTYGSHSRSDHRDISVAFDAEEEIYSTATDYLIAFMGEGNIRLIPEVPGIDIQVEPTDAQYQALEDYIAFWLTREGNFVVDISDEKGNIVDAFTYSRGAYPKDIVLDIKEHFEDQHTLDESGEDGDWGYHYGDLGKADYRHQFGNRNTGGFGTGVYFVGTPISQRKDGNSYKNRPEHKIDFSKYKLFKPRNNEQAYKLHDALLAINNMAPNFKRVPKQWDEVLDEFDGVFDDYYTPLNALDDDDHSTPVTLIKQALLKYIRKYIDYYPFKLNKDDDLMDIAREIESSLVEEAKEFYHILNSLSSTLGYYNEDKLRKIVIDALQDKSDVAPATLIMKALGYDGVDVRHLDHDAQGLSGLDNFGFGSVIYDLRENK